MEVVDIDMVSHSQIQTANTHPLTGYEKQHANFPVCPCDAHRAPPVRRHRAGMPEARLGGRALRLHPQPGEQRPNVLVRGDCLLFSPRGQHHAFDRFGLAPAPGSCPVGEDGRERAAGSASIACSAKVVHGSLLDRTQRDVRSGGVESDRRRHSRRTTSGGYGSTVSSRTCSARSSRTVRWLR